MLPTACNGNYVIYVHLADWKLLSAVVTAKNSLQSPFSDDGAHIPFDLGEPHSGPPGDVAGPGVRSIFFGVPSLPVESASSPNLSVRLRVSLGLSQNFVPNLRIPSFVVSPHIGTNLFPSL